MNVYDEILEQVDHYYTLFDKNRFREGLRNGREKFEKLPVKSVYKKNKLIKVGKREVLSSILQGLHANATKPDLKVIGIKTPFSFFQNKKGFKLSPNAQIIYQSPTGLFERKRRVSEIK
ncbi:Cas9 endonuclease PAM-interacting domain-containing protein [Secundilactobacillus silagei]|nr:Cas9 endonuclease PAM-interacting domain-containing protein [Secundilactobacillus silagei]